MSKIIMGIQLQQRVDTATTVQNLLTENGCIIKTRLGVHSASTDSCSSQGLILLEFIDNSDAEIKKLEKELTDVSGVVVKKMVF